MLLQIAIGASYILTHPGDGESTRKTGFVARVTVDNIHPDDLYPICVIINEVLDANPTATPTIGSKRWVDADWLSQP